MKLVVTKERERLRAELLTYIKNHNFTFKNVPAHILADIMEVYRPVAFTGSKLTDVQQKTAWALSFPRELGKVKTYQNQNGQTTKGQAEGRVHRKGQPPVIFPIDAEIPPEKEIIKKLKAKKEQFERPEICTIEGFQNAANNSTTINKFKGLLMLIEEAGFEVVHKFSGHKMEPTSFGEKNKTIYVYYNYGANWSGGCPLNNLAYRFRIREIKK